MLGKIPLTSALLITQFRCKLPKPPYLTANRVEIQQLESHSFNYKSLTMRSVDALEALPPRLVQKQR